MTNIEQCSFTYFLYIQSLVDTHKHFTTHKFSSPQASLPPPLFKLLHPLAAPPSTPRHSSWDKSTRISYNQEQEYGWGSINLKPGSWVIPNIAFQSLCPFSLQSSVLVTHIRKHGCHSMGAVHVTALESLAMLTPPCLSLEPNQPGNGLESHIGSFTQAWAK